MRVPARALVTCARRLGTKKSGSTPLKNSCHRPLVRPRGRGGDGLEQVCVRAEDAAKSARNTAELPGARGRWQACRGRAPAAAPSRIEQRLVVASAGVGEAKLALRVLSLAHPAKGGAWSEGGSHTLLAGLDRGSSSAEVHGPNSETARGRQTLRRTPLTRSTRGRTDTVDAVAQTFLGVPFASCGQRRCGANRVGRLEIET